MLNAHWNVKKAKSNLNRNFKRFKVVLKTICTIETCVNFQQYQQSSALARFKGAFKYYISMFGGSGSDQKYLF